MGSVLLIVISDSETFEDLTGEPILLMQYRSVQSVDSCGSAGACAARDQCRGIDSCGTAGADTAHAALPPEISADALIISTDSEIGGRGGFSAQTREILIVVHSKLVRY